MTAPTGKPSEIRNFPPDVPPRPATQQQQFLYFNARCEQYAHQQTGACQKAGAQFVYIYQLKKITALPNTSHTQTAYNDVQTTQLSASNNPANNEIRADLNNIPLFDISPFFRRRKKEVIKF